MINPEDIRSELIHLFPDFKGQWESDENYFRAENGGFTLHGLFAEFSHFVEDNFSRFPQDKSIQLFAKVEEWLISDQSDLSNAVATCLIENLAGLPISATIRDLLGTRSMEYFDKWDG